MKTCSEKWDDSLALRIPKPLAEESNLRKDSSVDVTVRRGKLVVAIEEPQPSLENLVAKITPRNRYSEVETGKTVGNEVW
jgi:antitoxin MazE